MSIEAAPDRAGPNRPTAKRTETRCRTPAEERIYGQKLLEAIRAASNPSRPSRSCPSRAIKEAADSALASAARGRTRWSRAVLWRQWRKHKLLLKTNGKIRRHSPRQRRWKSPPQRQPAAVGKVTERLRLLSRLVPGCRKLSEATLLEEAADYVAALQMQVKAMRALADQLSVAAAAPSLH